jgi:hypothetical protein
MNLMVVIMEGRELSGPATPRLLFTPPVRHPDQQLE